MTDRVKRSPLQSIDIGNLFDSLSEPWVVSFLLPRRDESLEQCAACYPDWFTMILTFHSVKGKGWLLFFIYRC